MKSRHLVAIVLATATFGMGSTAFADGPMQRVIRAQTDAVQHADDRRDHHRDHRAERRDDRRDWRAERRQDRRDWHAERREDRRDWRDDRRHERYQPHPPHYRPARTVHHHHYHARGPEFKRGRYIPREYRHRQYVVVNHHHHRLAAPPRGHHWVQVGGDYVLIAVATGLIANVILSH
ncbi:MAG: RcnB family protein [Hydrogenophaga sp.]|jgi:Ni/Co efflux regulator RcnB|nr:RcnB family protein [Hydrogenophaga sp.]